MHATTITNTTAATTKLLPCKTVRTEHYEDPLDADTVEDTKVVATRRGLIRLALIATEAGGRFQREGTGQDPMAWMLAPRRLFAGSTAIEACLVREDFMRALLLHGLSLGLDADAEMIDALLCDTPSDVDGGFWEGRGDDGPHPARNSVRRLRLYSSIIVIARGSELIHLFHASVAPAASVVRERIRSRFGAAAARQADIRIGVDLDCPMTSGMLPPTFRGMIERGSRIRWSAMAGLDVTVEHRIPC